MARVYFSLFLYIFFFQVFIRSIFVTFQSANFRKISDIFLPRSNSSAVNNRNETSEKSKFLEVPKKQNYSSSLQTFIFVVHGISSFVLFRLTTNYFFWHTLTPQSFMNYVPSVSTQNKYKCEDTFYLKT